LEVKKVMTERKIKLQKTLSFKSISQFEAKNRQKYLRTLNVMGGARGVEGH